MSESANAYQAHNDPVDPVSDDGEEALDFDDDEEHDVFSSCVALNDVTVFEAAELDAIALLADTWNDDLDSEVSAQLVQASAQASLSFGKEKGKGKDKANGKGKGRYPVRPSHVSLEDSRRRLKGLKAKTESRACGRKGHWANDRECAMSSYSSYGDTTRSFQPSEPGRRVFRSQRIQWRSRYVRMYAWSKRTFTDRTNRTDTFDSDSFCRCRHEGHSYFRRSCHGWQWRSTGDRGRPQDRLGKTFQSGTYRGMLYGIVLRDYPKQVVSLAKAASVPTNMREFLSWAQRHYRIDVTASTVERKTGGLASAGACPRGCKEFSLTNARTPISSG